MAFDPNAYIAGGGAPQPSGTTGEFDPRAYLADKPAGPQVGTAEALGRGALQGATLGFSDEGAGVLGGVSNALMGKSFTEGYRADRDESRTANKAAEEQHPLAYGGGELGAGIATAFVPGLNLAKGASLGAHVAQGAALGAAQGLGSSEADITRGQVGEALKDVGAGAALGGAAGAAAKGLQAIVSKAPERQVERFLVDAGDGATIKMRDKIAMAGGKIDRFIENNPGEARAIMKAAKDPEKLVSKLGSALDERGTSLDGIYNVADRTTGGVKATKVASVLAGLRQTLTAAPHEAGERLGALEKIIDNTTTAWGDKTRIPSQDLRQLVTDLQKTAYAKSVVAAERPGQEAAREASSALKEALTEHVRAYAPHRIDDLERLNGEVSSLAQLQAAAEYRALRQSSMPQNRLKNIIGAASDHAALAASLATHNPLPYVAKKFAIPAAQAGAQVADNALARVVKAAMAGSAPAAILRQASETGVPRAVAEGVISRFARERIAQ